MLKRALVLGLVLTGILVVAWSPIGAQGLPAGVALQATQPPPGLPTIAITLVQPTGAPANPDTGMPSTLVIGLLIIILIAVIVGGMALLGRRQS